MPRLYCNAPISVNTRMELPASAARHAMVLRLKTDDEVTLFNGLGGEYTAKVVDLHRHGATVDVLTFLDRESELPYLVTLVQAIPENPKMDLVIEKAVELGVTRICAVESQRSIVRLTEERAENRAARWKSIIISASEQCGRNRFAEVADITTYRNWVTNLSPESFILLCPDAEVPLADWALENPPHDVTLVIGPEGDFSPEEKDLAVRHGAVRLSLGPRILRTETASIAAVSALTALWSRSDLKATEKVP